MKKIFILTLTLIFAGILALQTACSDGGNENSASERKSSSENPVSSSTVPETSSDDLSEADLWDVSDVDISHIAENSRLIAFTFDDGPTDKTDALLDVFESFNEKNPDFIARATLFTIGSKISREYSQVLERAVSMKFELGNHTFTHTDLTTLTDEKIIEELSETDKALKTFDGKEIHLVRPAGGHADNRVLSTYRSTFINWTTSLDTSDWENSVTENDIYDTVSKNLCEGGIVLMHQGCDKTINAVKRLLPDLKARGFQVVSVSELIKFYDIKAEIGKLYDNFI